MHNILTVGNLERNSYAAKKKYDPREFSVSYISVYLYLSI